MLAITVAISLTHQGFGTIVLAFHKPVLSELREQKPTGREVRACIKRLNDGILFREPHSHEPYTVRWMSDADLRESKKLFSHQKQEKEMLVLSQISLFGTLKRWVLSELKLHPGGKAPLLLC
jgi:hypothetical protein